MAATATHAPSPAPAGEAPFAGYDGLDTSKLVAGFCDHSQIELEAIEDYERSHGGRKAVLDKLRFMRQREPLPGYDSLSVEEILAALEEVDLATIKKVRGYERKFASRPRLLDEVVRVQRRRRTTEPASAARSYQPLSATAGAKEAAEKSAEKSARRSGVG